MAEQVKAESATTADVTDQYEAEVNQTGLVFCSIWAIVGTTVRGFYRLMYGCKTENICITNITQ